MDFYSFSSFRLFYVLKPTSKATNYVEEVIMQYAIQSGSCYPTIRITTPRYNRMGFNGMWTSNVPTMLTLSMIEKKTSF